jgi:hypothetical protein
LPLIRRPKNKENVKMALNLLSKNAVVKSGATQKLVAVSSAAMKVQSSLRAGGISTSPTVTYSRGY